MSSIAEEIAGLKVAAADQTTASQALAQEVAGKMGQIDQKVASAEAQFDEWRQQKDIIGDPSQQGTMRMNVFQGFVVGTGVPYGVGGTGGFAGKVADLGSSENVYVHFKTPMNINTSDEMFWFNIRGYCYGSSSVIDETIVGYAYSPQRAIINKVGFGNMFPDSYVDSAGNVILRIKVPVAYYLTVRIETMRVGTGTLFEVGSFDAKVSLTATVEF
jgi:hypothetical protein